jgi:hypothetical protein
MPRDSAAVRIRGLTCAQDFGHGQVLVTTSGKAHPVGLSRSSNAGGWHKFLTNLSRLTICQRSWAVALASGYLGLRLPSESQLTVQTLKLSMGENNFYLWLSG